MLDTPDKPRPPDPCSLVIFGVTGDFTHRLITPALYNLAEANLLPETQLSEIDPDLPWAMAWRARAAVWMSTNRQVLLQSLL